MTEYGCVDCRLVVCMLCAYQDVKLGKVVLAEVVLAENDSGKGRSNSGKYRSYSGK